MTDRFAAIDVWHPQIVFEVPDAIKLLLASNILLLHPLKIELAQRLLLARVVIELLHPECIPESELKHIPLPLPPETTETGEFQTVLQHPPDMV